MKTSEKTKVTVEAVIDAPVEKVWNRWNAPEHITKWCYADDSWHAPQAQNDLRTGGTFKTRMEAKDGSTGFDFSGKYSCVETNKVIEYSMDDGRQVKVVFTPEGGKTKVTETFDAEDQNPVEMQRGGWQSILNNFKRYAEQN